MLAMLKRHSWFKRLQVSRATFKSYLDALEYLAGAEDATEERTHLILERRRTGLRDGTL